MTKQQLEEIFHEMDKGEYNPSSQEVIMLVEEIERLMNERDTAFARGVAAMREAAAKHLIDEARAYQNMGVETTATVHTRRASEIRAIPIPEEK